MLSWTLMASLAMAEPDRTEITDSNPAVTTPVQPVLTPKEIYQLLDDERWSKGVIEARRLVATDPANGLAYLTLGDALSHYPNEDGDIYLAFEAWMTAKTFMPPRSSLNKVVQKRLSWALERSGIVKLEPSQFTGINGFGEGIRVEAFSHLDVDWSSRIEASTGAVYITNIPPGTVVLKITSDLGVYVTSISTEAGTLETVSVPTETTSVDSSVEAGEWLLYLDEGRQVVDTLVQSTIVDPRMSFKDLANTMVQLPRAPVPSDSTTTFISPYKERIVYNNGARQTLIGGLYVLEVEKNGTKTYADIVVHADLSVETIRQLVLNDELRRSEMASPVVRETMEDSQVVEPDSVAPVVTVVATGPEEIQETAPSEQEIEIVDTSADQSDSEDVSSESSETVAVTATEESSDQSVDKIQIESSESEGESESASTGDTQPEVPEVDSNTPEDLPIISETQTALPEPTFLWSPRSGAQVQRTSLVLAGGAAAFTGYAMYRADRFADLANAETQSQVSFEEYQSKSVQWNSNFGIASVVTGHVLSLYIGTKVLEWWAVEETSQSVFNQTASSGVGVDASATLSEGGQ